MAFLNSTLTTDYASALQRVCSITRRTRLMRSHGCQRRASFMASTSVVDPLLRHLDRIGISIPLSGEHDVGRRQHRKNAHHRLRAPSVAVGLVRLRLDQPALIVDVWHVRLRSLALHPTRVHGVGETMRMGGYPEVNMTSTPVLNSRHPTARTTVWRRR